MASNWSPEELAVLESFKVPGDIQTWLDSVAYSADPIYRSPRSVMRDRKAHCFDGALFAAAALRHMGYPPLIIELAAERDDDHLLALFRHKGLWGCVAKSNFVGLRYRDPIFRTLRELALSYWESYYNLIYERSLRSYCATVNLARLDNLNWMTEDQELEAIATALGDARHYPLFDMGMWPQIRRVDERTFRANMLGTDMSGVFVPKE